MIKKWLNKRKKKKLLIEATAYAMFLMTRNVRPVKALQLAKKRFKVPIEDMAVLAMNYIKDEIDD